MNLLTWPISKLLLFLIIGLRPLLGPARCPFTITCGKFAVHQLQEQPLHKALWEICKRLLACMGLFQQIKT